MTGQMLPASSGPWPGSCVNPRASTRKRTDQGNRGAGQEHAEFGSLRQCWDFSDPSNAVQGLWPKGTGMELPQWHPHTFPTLY